jgi:hypothetical protein
LKIGAMHVSREQIYDFLAVKDERYLADYRLMDSISLSTFYGILNSESLNLSDIKYRYGNIYV